MCCIRGICILAPGANVSANLIFHPVCTLNIVCQPRCISRSCLCLQPEICEHTED